MFIFNYVIIQYFEFSFPYLIINVTTFFLNKFVLKSNVKNVYAIGTSVDVSKTTSIVPERIKPAIQQETPAYSLPLALSLYNSSRQLRAAVGHTLQ